MTTLPKAIVDHTKHFRRVINVYPPLLGDIAEFGCYDGGSTIQLAQYDNRRVWAFDTFEGLPAADYTDKLDAGNSPGKFKPTNNIYELCTLFPNILPIRGRFAETLPLIPKELRFALVYLDCDYYLSSQQVLQWLPAHLTSGAGIVVDDYTACPGVKQAVDEFLEQWKLSIIESGQIIKWTC